MELMEQPLILLTFLGTKAEHIWNSFGTLGD